MDNTRIQYLLYVDHVRSDTYHLLTLTNYMRMVGIKYITQYVSSAHLQRLNGNKPVEDMFLLVSPGGQTYTSFVSFLDSIRFDGAVQ